MSDEPTSLNLNEPVPFSRIRNTPNSFPLLAAPDSSSGSGPPLAGSVTGGFTDAGAPLRARGTESPTTAKLSVLLETGNSDFSHAQKSLKASAILSATVVTGTLS